MTAIFLSINVANCSLADCYNIQGLHRLLDYILNYFQHHHSGSLTPANDKCQGSNIGLHIDVKLAPLTLTLYVQPNPRFEKNN
jgi:hypothetical protein